MIGLTEMNGGYFAQQLLTLGEAKQKYPRLHYVEWLDDKILGFVELSKRQLDYEIFNPVYYKDMQLKSNN